LIEAVETRTERWAWDIADGDDATARFEALQEAKLALITFICGESEE
jgi:hypothetical protein